MESRLKNILDDKGYKVHTVDPNITLFECAQKMHDLRIGALVVLQDNNIVGIVSERDIINCMVENKDKDIKKIPLCNTMTKKPETVTSDMTVTDAMELVTEKRHRHLPVVENNKLIGMISIGDLTRWAMLAQKDEIKKLTHYIQGDHQV